MRYNLVKEGDIIKTTPFELVFIIHKIMKVTVSKKDGTFLFCLLSIFEPDIFKYYVLTDNLFLAMKVITLLIVCADYAKIINRKVAKFTPFVIAYVCGIIIANIINSQDLFFVIKKTIECILVCMLLEYVIYFYGLQGIKNFFNYFLFMLVVNLLLIIPYPNGLASAYEESENYKLFFLGIKNSMFNWCVIPLLLGNIIISLTHDRKFERWYIFFLAIAFVTILYTGSSTGVLLYMLWVFYYAFSHVLDLKLSLKKIIPWMTLTYVGIVIFRVLDVFSGVIYLLFKKDATFSGRTNLWSMAIELFLDRKLIGYGLSEAGVIIIYGRSYTAHNLILEMLVDGGIFLFAIWLIMIIALVLRVSKCNDSSIRNHVSMTFILYFVASLFGGSLYLYRWFAVLTIIYHAKEISILSENNPAQFY